MKLPALALILFLMSNAGKGIDFPYWFELGGWLYNANPELLIKVMDDFFPQRLLLDDHLRKTAKHGEKNKRWLKYIFSPALAKAKLGCSCHCHKSVCLSVCMYVCPAVHEVLFLRNYSTKSFQTWQADALGHPDVPFSKWSWSDWHCGHKSQIVKRMCG